MKAVNPLESSKLDYKSILPCLLSSGLVIDQFYMDKHDSSTLGYIQTDSRKTSPGDIFIAFKGEASNGHLYIPDAVTRGATFVILDDPLQIQHDLEVPTILVKNSRAAWSRLCALSYGEPHKELKFYGVTGTNGKTSTIFNLKNMLALSQVKYLMFGTLGIDLCGEEHSSSHTTPDPNVFHYWLARARDRNVQIVIMEVSSHSIVQKKLFGILFEGVAFTSFSRDHLDFHGTLDNYFAAKFSLLQDYLQTDGTVFFNSSIFPSPLSRDHLKQLAGKQRIAYGIESHSADFDGLVDNIVRIDRNETESLQTHITLSDGRKSWSGKINFFADYAIENFVASSLLFSLICQKPFPVDHWMQLPQIPGRMEVVDSQGPIVIVDYAHTPDALEKAIISLKTISGSNVWLVFGCGGDRDRGKRPIMAQMAERYADHIILTSDNPRSENPDGIIGDICKGFSGLVPFTIKVNRKDAIYFAILQAGSSDIILIAGKGHETYQLIGNQKEFFDDRIEAKKSLNHKRTE
jgi:UDP-N-acetylmuramoyl-L-alanyl-D-glutamate--2,6-diaminopimelate ligase